ncbi:MAG: NADH-dependent phenylglyoxylate dehydrogenase subunit alpha [candidate division WS2 bacterium]|uniref:NADH-dependent phenylglyoxylate dehydrogenase subunit alpha n=1 Tax=Psychracetigena formicireducens TaxID=2986056 RepID=A0A9E2F643_PSYF1|nr:NADH-dependent phenylglyoxylate dehydrogenase subunit alpha [Candidatus Psychracetigena formicireducens]MBT9144208.1 NADH-dependent phenylglyoxylate dehydrogenase subunit alpha [Candidatus Psychracetigena formicireducens]MBT9150717.1 NADH-dependent phenylglyoxylate dehydrogenase subunit alpha [Candidatus Psychracetigena formicireducens]
MGEKVLIKGVEAIAESAIRAGCRMFFGYPITPQNETPEYMSRRLPQVEGIFLQAESEIAAINMVMGASAAGARVMTTTSSPGFSLMMEGMSYLVGMELPCVVANVVRGGPGLGNIAPAQSDYFQATKGGGHGDYKTIVFGPSTVQELVELTYHSFDLADKYRNPVVLLTDGALGQMMEPVIFPEMRKLNTLPEKPWALTGALNREKNIIMSFEMDPKILENINWELQKKFQKISEDEVKYEEYATDDAEFVIVAYGTIGRIAKSTVKALREENIPVGLIRPISLWPFPYGVITQLVPQVEAFMVVEMSAGQMVEDVRLAVGDRRPVFFYGRPGGMVPSPRDITEKVKQCLSMLLS